MIKLIKKNNKPVITAQGEKCFWMCTGQILANLAELVQVLEHMDENTFSYHVNQDRNDFSNWISDVLGQAKLGAAVRKIKTASTMAKKIKSYL